MSIGEQIKNNIILGMKSAGAELITVGKGGDVPTIAAAVNHLANSTLYVDDVTIVGTSLTASCANGSDTVTVGGTGVNLRDGTTPTNMSDLLWSGDGAHWYRVVSIISATVMKLEIPYQGTTVSGGTLHVASARKQHIKLLDGYFDEPIDLSPLAFADVHISSFGNAVVRGASTVGSNSNSMIHLPESGKVKFDYFKARPDAFGDTYGWGASNAFMRSTETATEVEISKCDWRHNGVDMFGGSATCSVGSMLIEDSYLLSCQDGIDITTQTEKSIINRTTIHSLVQFLQVFPLRMRTIFGAGSYAFNDCDFILDEKSASGIIGSCSTFFANQLAGVVTAKNCRFKGRAYNASNLYTLGQYAGATGPNSLTLNRCDFDLSGDSGTPEIVQTSAGWTSGTVNINQCTLNGTGGTAGGGALTLNTNANIP